MTSAYPFGKPTAPGTIHLRLMETSDLHAHVMPYDYYRDCPAPTMGLARTASLIAQCRAEVANCLLFDNGDFLQGNPLGDYTVFGGGLSPGQIHPVIAAMNTLGYDAGTLGNHEFNYGLEFLQTSLTGATFPMICTNVAWSLGNGPLADRTLLPPTIILDREMVDGAGRVWPLRIGVVGLVPPQIVDWDMTLLAGRIATRDMLEAARAHVPEMRMRGADLIVALVHSGIGLAEESARMENAAIPIARIPGIDAVLTGHTHQVFPSTAFEGLTDVDVAKGTLCGKPAVMPGFWGSHLGVIDLLIERHAGVWRIDASQSRALPIAGRGPDGARQPIVDSDKAVVRLSRPAHLATRDYMRQTVGTTTGRVHSYFALVADCAALQLVCQAQADHVAAALLGTQHAHLPVLSAAAPFKAGGRGGPENYTDIPVGGLVLRNVADLYAFPNTVRAVRTKGASVAEWLELSARIFNRITTEPGDQEIIAPQFPSYNFDIITGLTYRIDPTKPPRYGPDGVLANPHSRRITDLRLRGKPIDPDADVIVATNNYRVNGFIGKPWADGIAIVYEAPVTIRDILLRHIAAKGRIDARVTANWSFVPLPGRGLVFSSAPAARNMVVENDARQIEPVGPIEDGFYRYRLRG